MEKYLRKYRISSTRLQNWDYGWNAAYFVTICTHNREWYFGKIESGIMIYSELGSIAHKLWTKIPEHFPFVELSEFVIMPDHIHGIIIINKPHQYGNPVDVETQNFASLHPCFSKNRFGPQSENLASIIRGYKIGVIKYAHEIESGFRWQPRYHDHIIRDNIEYERITDYIRQNPQKWDRR
ncbi:MAG: transposase [Chloroflexota bacterium]